MDKNGLMLVLRLQCLRTETALLGQQVAAKRSLGLEEETNQ